MVNISKENKLRRNAYSIIPLTGGLGNQLFQYGFALYVRNLTKGDVKLDFTLGNPRLTSGQISILNLELNQEIFVEQNQTPTPKRIYAKAYGWILTRKLSKQQGNLFTDKIFDVIAKLILCWKYRSILKVQSSDNLGYDAKVKMHLRNLFIGYFQTYIYSSEIQVLNELQSVRPKIVSKEYEQIKSQIEHQNALLIHLRLTDYLKEQHFGIPSRSYFEKSLSQITALRHYYRIWIASDDLMLSREILKDLDTKLPISFLDSTDLSDVEVWDLFRHFKGYIISNSSFSWWAAFLRKDRTAPVFCPDPWFQGMKDPDSLIPHEWHKVAAL